MTNFLRLWFFSLSFLGVLNFCTVSALSLNGLPDNREIPILNNQSNEIIHEDIGGFREGTYDAIRSSDGEHRIENMIGTQTKIESQEDAKSETIALIQRIINFALSFVSLIAFVLLLVAGFKMVTAAGDDKAFGAGKEALITILKAIWGIAVSWLLVSAIFWLVDAVIGK